MHGKPKQGCERFDRTRVQGLTATGRAVWLGEHGANPLRLRKHAERRDGEFRRAGETQP
jgi:hypothetical protein